jgi:hypothetical protein
VISTSETSCNQLLSAAIPDAMLLPTDECFAQEVPEPVYDGLTCPKYAIWDSNPGSWLAKEQKSRLRFGGRRLLLQQDIRRLTGWMRRGVETVIQARGGYTRYWTLNNRCRQVIHKWRFESEMTILSCFILFVLHRHVSTIRYSSSLVGRFP